MIGCRAVHPARQPRRRPNPQNAGGGIAVWILGDGNDTVNLTGTGSTWTAGTQVTSVAQAGNNPGQMVGFTEYTATATGGQQVHVYVQNAIAAAGNVAHN